MADLSPHLYRAYHLSPNGSFAQADVIEADDDSAALSKLDTISSPHGIELWDRNRFVGKVPAARRQADTAASA